MAHEHDAVFAMHMQDTYLHCTQSLAELLSTDATDGILCDIGMPVSASLFYERKDKIGCAHEHTHASRAATTRRAALFR
jgi:hypothetical protein